MRKALVVLATMLIACDWLSPAAPSVDLSLSDLGPDTIPTSPRSITLTLSGHDFTPELRVFLRNHARAIEVSRDDIRFIDSTRVEADVFLGAKAASWYVSVASGGRGRRSREIAFRVIGDDYPDSLKAKPCSYKASDQFGFVPGNCTSFAAWRLTEDGATFANSQVPSYVCSDGRTLTTWNHARCWDDAARAKGYAVDHTVRVGAIAQWNDAGYTVNGAPVGHVAYIAAVYPTTGEVLIEEYNFAVSCKYSTRRVKIVDIENVIHIHDL
jgi:surface antigen